MAVLEYGWLVESRTMPQVGVHGVKISHSPKSMHEACGFKGFSGSIMYSLSINLGARNHVSECCIVPRKLELDLVQW